MGSLRRRAVDRRPAPGAAPQGDRCQTARAAGEQSEPQRRWFETFLALVSCSALLCGGMHVPNDVILRSLETLLVEEIRFERSLLERLGMPHSPLVYFETAVDVNCVGSYGPWVRDAMDARPLRQNENLRVNEIVALRNDDGVAL